MKDGVLGGGGATQESHFQHQTHQPAGILNVANKKIQETQSKPEANNRDPT